MNFGIVTEETILDVELIDHSDEIKLIRENWLDMGVHLPNLKCYKIVTNSTNGTIEIYALNFKIYGSY